MGLQSYLMRRYEKSDFVLQLKAKFLIRLHLLILTLLPIIIAYSAYIQVYTVEYQYRISPAVIIPEIAGLLIMAIVFVFLIKGHFSPAAHLTMFILMSVGWAILFFSKNTAVIRLDTIVFLMCILSMTPLIVTRNKQIILYYLIGNLTLFFLFIYFCQDQFDISSGALKVYFADNTVSFIFVGLVAYQIFSITESALHKAELDIQERKLAEERASNAKVFLENSFASSPIGIILLDAKSIINYVNPVVLSWNSSETADFIGKSILENSPLQSTLVSASEIDESVRQQLRAGTHEVNIELEITGKDGQHMDLALSATNNYDKDGNDLGAVVFLTDITERKKSFTELQLLRNYLKNIIDSIPSMLASVDRDGRITEWNREAQKTSGVTADHAIGKLLSDVVPKMSAQMPNIQRAIREQKPIKHEKIIDIDEQGVRYLNINIYPLTAEGAEGAVIHVDDVTDQVRMEEMVVQSEKMVSIGGLAAGMAHEINNPLAAIVQNAQLLEKRLTGDFKKNQQAAKEFGTTMETIRSYSGERGILTSINAITESVQRASGIVGNMLKFSRKGESKQSLQDICQLVNTTVDLASKSYDLEKGYDFRNITIFREYSPSIPKVMCEPGEIQQVLFNILTNGSQAMIASPPEEGSAGQFDIRIQKEAGMIRIDIEDNGPGMAPETRKRIFEPFFTTKEIGVGTGLGLSISYFIITENHKGTIAVESTPGHGTRFTIHLPLNPAETT